MVEAGRSADLDRCRGTDPLLTQVWLGGDDFDDYRDTEGSNPLNN